MSDHGTAIEWTHVPGYKGETWNPVTGCDRVSPGCAHCYALEFAARLKAMGRERYQRDGDPKTSGPGFGLTLHRDKLAEPLRWRKPRAVFVNSMSDLFHEDIPDEYIAEVYGVMAAAHKHIFMVLTKRPERMHALLTNEDWVIAATEEATSWVKKPGLPLDDQASYCWPGEDYHEFPALRNVWLGVTIENRRFVDRADLLRQTPAAVRFISAEPLLGPLVYDEESDGDGHPATGGPCWFDGADLPPLELDGIDWLIAGGESGAGHRPIELQWVRDLREHCLAQRYDRDGFDIDLPGTRFFFKQWGGRTPKAGGRLLDGRTWDEFPVQEGR